ncbi:multidrug ABC transporter ATP-binding protein [Mycoplasma todarodis]|uniref:Multidrug ABC transporter ATP-binding protein n=1 Tax=Mycoplasma todarodis TaxID=1937191 RepID=A0A4R0XLW6_9MOLU|nr:multidrug ABC transporter ATP-binding protein [Mycoplasma todarodis]
MENIIEVKGLVKSFGKSTVVDDVSFKVKRGSFHGFLGANGAGKTTTIKAIIGAYNQYKGEITIDGLSSKLKITKNIIGYVPERPIFPIAQNVLTYLTYMGNLSGMTLRDSKQRVKELLDKYEVNHLAKKNPNRLSSGQKKKILLIQALINSPSLIIMDEPASNLDPIARAELFDDLRKLNKDGVTVFITSHILAELDGFINDATILSEGKVIFSGDVNTFKNGRTLVDAFLESVKPKEVSNV